MLFIGVLLTVWFVVWLYFANMRKDAYDIFISAIDEFFNGEEIEENEKELLIKSENKQIYHLNCDKCKYDWWSIESHPKFCPNCGKKR